MKKIIAAGLCALCLLLLCACGRTGEDFSQMRGDFSADVRYEMGGVTYAARYQKTDGDVTLTFTAPAGLCGCKLVRRGGETALLRGELSVPVRGAAALPCAFFDFAPLNCRRTAEGYVFSDGERTYTVSAAGGVDKITLECGDTRLSAAVDNICF